MLSLILPMSKLQHGEVNQLSKSYMNGKGKIQIQDCLTPKSMFFLPLPQRFLGQKSAEWIGEGGKTDGGEPY